ncbi:MAG: epimerase [Marmoricola sp.]|nr:epimerase [Marmoricola sp.]
MTGSPESRTTWVVGASGLLGTSVRRAAADRGDRLYLAAIPWHEPDAAVEALVRAAAGLPEHNWRMLWCAGSGVVGSSPEKLAGELDVVGRFLEQWRPSTDGAVFLASSAGGVYAGSAAPPFTEETVPVPLSPYGETKLRTEGLFAAFAQRVGVPLLTGRFSNLYGPGQDLSKGQGLISLLLRAHLTGVPLDIYVPLDTMRDYLYADDAAAMALAGLEYVAADRNSRTRILASEQSCTIASVVGEIRRITRRRPPLVLSPSANARFQTADLRMHSVLEPSLRQYVRTPFAVGVQACLAAVETAMHVPAARG